jgi:hypothetical protein
MSARERQPFSQRTLLALIAVGALGFVVMAYLMIAGEDTRGWQASPTTTSRSAVGYRAFTELLRRFDIEPVAPSETRLVRESLRIVLAPQTAQEVREILQATAPPVLIVLPKWRTRAPPLSDRVSDAQLRNIEGVQALARAIADDAVITRPDAVGAWRMEGVHGTPTLTRAQLVRSAKLCPVVSSAEGMLVARLCARPQVTVLADPDLLANYGLWRGDNAVLAVSLVARLRAGDGPVVALEAVSDRPSRDIWQLAVSPPFALVTFSALVAIGIALWAAATRFGPPADEPLPPPAGVFALIDVAARLLRDRSDGGRLLKRYADLVVLDLGRRLKAPAQLQGPAEIGRWLDGTPAAKGAAQGAAKSAPAYQELVRAIETIAPGDKAATVAAAARLHRWREELLNGR